MKRLVTLFISAGMLLVSQNIIAQIIPGTTGYHEQAFMYSNTDYIGSARIQGIGNAQISLGGDLSSAASNPAGLGFYNRSEFSITPSFQSFNAQSNYLGNSTNSSSGNFNIANLGIVFNKSKSDYKQNKWRGGSFAITFSRLNNLNSQINYSGLNQNNDIIDFYVQDANNQNLDYENLNGITKGAYYNYLMSEFLDAYINNGDTTFVPFYGRTFFSEFPSADFPTNQEEIISTSGGQNQWNFSYGGNFGDIIYFGIGLGIQTINYSINKRYTETYPGLQNDIVMNSVLDENLNTNGTGINGTFGIIARPVNTVTIGVSIVSPTKLNLSEKYDYTSTANYNNFNLANYGDYFDANYDLIATNPDADYTTFYLDNTVLNEMQYQEENIFDYSVTTPMKINAGASIFINKNGFVSADITYLDYSTMKLKSNDGSLENENSSINKLYQSVVQMRVGGEWRIKDFRLRAGYNLKPSPYKNSNINLNQQALSAGLGYRNSKFFSDIAATYKMYDTSYTPYSLDNPNDLPYLETENVDIKNNSLSFAVSLGMFF